MQSSLKSPGVYVVEVASGNAPIAGVGTSTAGFIGVIKPASSSAPTTPPAPTTRKVGSATSPADLGQGEGGNKKTYQLPVGDYPLVTAVGSYKFFVDGVEAELDPSPITNKDTSPITNNETDKKTSVKFKNSVPANARITGYYEVQAPAPDPVVTVSTPATYTIQIDAKTTVNSVSKGEVKLCTNFSEFKNSFGDFSDNAGQNTLAHAVYGFFRNGGTRCFVVWVDGEDKIQSALDQFEAIDEIALVVAPGLSPFTSDGKPSDAIGKIKDHCYKLGDRFAILDGPKEVSLSDATLVAKIKPFNSDYAALYFPWIHVFDPVTKKELSVPPSGHIAGVYARVDTQRGVHKAPANEPILGAVGLAYPISKATQDGLNLDGINCIRNLNGNILVWGARTLGGDANGEFKYINVRRLFNYLRESIDEGTQWSVFEPNSPDLWAKIRRNVTAFLTIVWRSGALFGTTPEQAFYVKCDEETNPPELRDRGQVITEIGVAVVRPAEFVIFKISQWSGNTGS